MSGKPYPEGVTEAVDLLDRLARLNREITNLEVHQKRLLEAHGERTATYEQLAKLLRDMDLESRGNGGYEHRLAWFLGEMRRQVKEGG